MGRLGRYRQAKAEAKAKARRTRVYLGKGDPWISRREDRVARAKERDRLIRSDYNASQAYKGGDDGWSDDDIDGYNSDLLDGYIEQVEREVWALSGANSRQVSNSGIGNDGKRSQNKNMKNPPFTPVASKKIKGSKHNLQVHTAFEDFCERLNREEQEIDERIQEIRARAHAGGVRRRRVHMRNREEERRAEILQRERERSAIERPETYVMAISPEHGIAYWQPTRDPLSDR